MNFNCLHNFELVIKKIGEMKIEILSWEFIFGKGANWKINVDNKNFNLLVIHRFEYDSFFEVIDREILTVINLDDKNLLVGEFRPFFELPEHTPYEFFIDKVKYVDLNVNNTLKFSDLIYEIAGKISEKFNDLNIFDSSAMALNKDLIKKSVFELDQDYLDETYIFGPNAY
jgi:hypothetical protein